MPLNTIDAPSGAQSLHELRVDVYVFASEEPLAPKGELKLVSSVIFISLLIIQFQLSVVITLSPLQGSGVLFLIVRRTPCAFTL